MLMDFAGFLALAQSQVKTDGDDDALLTQHAMSAVGIAAGFCRRNLYWSPADLEAAQAGFADGIAAAENAWAACKDQYAPKSDWDYWDVYFSDPQPPTTQDYINYRMLTAGRHTYLKTIGDLYKINDGLVIDDDIVAALLLITAHLYQNRQEVIAQTGAAAVQLPMGAQRILETKMAV